MTSWNGSAPGCTTPSSRCTTAAPRPGSRSGPPQSRSPCLVHGEARPTTRRRAISSTRWGRRSPIAGRIRSSWLPLTWWATWHTPWATSTRKHWSTESPSRTRFVRPRSIGARVGSGRWCTATATRSRPSPARSDLATREEPPKGVGDPAVAGHRSGLDVEAEHHSALVVLGDVAMRHPSARIRDVEHDVDGFSCSHEDGVLPDEVRLLDAIAREHQEPPRAVHVERVRHWMVGVHLVDETDLDLVSNAELPVDCCVRCAGIAVDELPAHVLCCGAPIHLDHVVLPLDAVRMVVVVGGSFGALVRRVSTVLVMLLVRPVHAVPLLFGDAHQMCRNELHAAFRTAIGCVARH